MCECCFVLHSPTFAFLLVFVRFCFAVVVVVVVWSYFHYVEERKKIQREGKKEGREEIGKR